MRPCLPLAPLTLFRLTLYPVHYLLDGHRRLSNVETKRPISERRGESVRTLRPASARSVDALPMRWRNSYWRSNHAYSI